MQTFINSVKERTGKVISNFIFGQTWNISTPYDDVGMECIVMLNNWPHERGGGLMFYSGKG